MDPSESARNDWAISSERVAALIVMMFGLWSDVCYDMASHSRRLTSFPSFPNQARMAGDERAGKMGEIIWKATCFPAAYRFRRGAPDADAFASTAIT